MTQNQNEHMSVDSGETIVEHPRSGGPVVAYLDAFDTGTETVSVTVKASNLRQAIGSDLADSYDDVFLYTDGERIAVTDHREPIEEADEPTIHGFNEAIVRTNVIEPTDDTVRTIVGRENARKALEQFGSAVVAVFIEQDFPMVIQNETKTVAVAPVGKPQDLPTNRKGGSPA